jgi:3-isopropylmalate/(R)-2-methylmalate dehydratase small subunit
MKVKGTVFKYGDNIDTDAIIPARYLNQTDPRVLAKHCMEDIDPTFAQKVKPGDIIVANRNFGCGSSREHAPIAIKASGVSCIVASSFARIFYRNAINIGLSILECEDAAKNIAQGDEIEVDFCSGNIHNLTGNQEYQSLPFPDFILEVMNAGGLINYVKKSLTEKLNESRR